MQRLNRSSLLLAAIFTSAMAANLFTNPPAPSQDANYDYSKNPVYQMGDSINIRWELAVKYEWVNMWIEAPPKGKPGENDINNYIQQFASVEEEFATEDDRYKDMGLIYNGHANCTWVIELINSPIAQKLMNETGFAVARFVLHDLFGTGNVILTSRYFNLTNNAPAQSIESKTTEATTRSLATSTSTTRTPSSTIAITPTNSLTGSHHSPPETAIVGGVVGGSLGGLIILGLTAFIIWKRTGGFPSQRRHKSASTIAEFPLNETVEIGGTTIVECPLNEKVEIDGCSIIEAPPNEKVEMEDSVVSLEVGDRKD